MKFSTMKIGCNWRLLFACFCVAVLALPTEVQGKRSFGIQRRQKSNKSYSARRGGANASPDNSPIPQPSPPKSASGGAAGQSSTLTKTNAQSNQNAPVGPPPAYPGMAHHNVPGGGAPPAYSPHYGNPPAYNSYQPGYPSAGYGMAGPGMGMGMGKFSSDYLASSFSKIVNLIIKIQISHAFLVKLLSHTPESPSFCGIKLSPLSTILLVV